MPVVNVFQFCLEHVYRVAFVAIFKNVHAAIFLLQPLAITRPSWRKRGPLYTEYGIQIRCVQKDQTGNVSWPSFIIY